MGRREQLEAAWDFCDRVDGVEKVSELLDSVSDDTIVQLACFVSEMQDTLIADLALLETIAITPPVDIYVQFCFAQVSDGDPWITSGQGVVHMRIERGRLVCAGRDSVYLVEG